MWAIHLVCGSAAAKSRKPDNFARGQIGVGNLGQWDSLAQRRQTSVVSNFDYMNASQQFPIAPGRKIGAWVCLIAVVMLWSPLWAAAWQSAGINCCDNGMCAAQRHSNPSHQHPQRAKHQESPMNCERHDESGLTPCSMTCCQESTHSFTAALIFVLPEATIISEPARALATPVRFVPSEFLQSFEPLSPPPRLSLFSL